MSHIFQAFDALLFATVSNWASENARRPRGEVIDKLVRKTEFSAWTFVTLVRFVPVMLLNFDEGPEHRLTFKYEHSDVGFTEVQLAGFLQMCLPRSLHPSAFIAQERCIRPRLISCGNHDLIIWKQCGEL